MKEQNYDLFGCNKDKVVSSLWDTFIDICHHAYIKTHYNETQIGLQDHNPIISLLKDKGISHEWNNKFH